MFKNLTWGDLYNTDTALDVLLYWEPKRKRNKKQIDLGDTVITEVDTMDELMAPEVEPVEVATIEEVVGPVIDDDYDSEDNAPKSTDMELATSVAMDILEGNVPDMSPEDFTGEVWAEAWLIANETYYSEPDDYKEEVGLGGETIISMSNNRLDDFYSARLSSIESWEDEGYTSAKTEDYVYEDDELNVPDKCDATIMSFGKALWCMMPRAA
jgi:hypothetical protein